MAPIQRPDRGSIQKTTSRVARKDASARRPADNSSQVSIAFTNGVDHDLGDLQDIAARVGNEVEEFAEILDQYKDQLQNAGTARHAAYGLCAQYRDYAKNKANKIGQQVKVQQLQQMREQFAKRTQSTTTSRRGSVSTVKDGDDDLKELKRWRSETDTWDLMCAILTTRYPSDRELSTRQAKLAQIGSPHRYMPEQDVWQHFLLTDNTAQERHLILQWLVQAADHDQESIKTLAEELEKKAGQAGGMWTNGWMETRERIKGAKRMRFNDEGPLDIRRSDNKDLLVSLLDPDAPAREQRSLEMADASSERSMWMTCFEMLRRGRSWAEISKWCTDRNQGWKAISMGTSAEGQLALGWSGPAAGVLWRKMCLIAARSDTAEQYEAAVYGLLAGDLDSVKAVARTWDDHIFAHFNVLVKEAYDHYILQKQALQLPLDFVRKHNLGQHGPDMKQKNEPAIQQQIVRHASQAAKPHDRAQAAMQTVQGALIGNSARDLLLEIGTAVADAAWKDGPSAVIRPVSARGKLKDVTAAAMVRDDPDALRIVAHILLVFRYLDPTSFADTTINEFDNVIAGYIQLLRVALKREPTPLYASLMAPERCHASLAQVMADMLDAEESKEFIGLLRSFKVDEIAVIKGQCAFLLEQSLANGDKKSRFAMLERTKEELYPGQRIMLDGLDSVVSDDEDALISGLSVFFLVPNQWTVTFETLARACGTLLVKEHFAAARYLVDQLNFEQLSMSKSASRLGRAISVFDAENVARASETPRHAHQIELLQRESRKYYDMTLLVNAINALETWRLVEHEYASKIPRPSSVPIKVKRALEDVKVAMEPLLGGILVEAKDEEEAAQFAKIRALYLPEIILAYITVLCTAAHMVSRDELLTAMDLAPIIATEESNGISKAFVDTGRMTELVEMFAETAKIMLKLNEKGKPRKEKKGGLGKTLGIWEIYG